DARETFTRLQQALDRLQAYRDAAAPLQPAYPHDRILAAPVEQWIAQRQRVEASNWLVRLLRRPALRRQVRAHFNLAGAAAARPEGDLDALRQAQARRRELEAVAAALPAEAPYR